MYWPVLYAKLFLWSPYGIGQTIIFMAALRSRCGHYIFALWFLSIYLLSFFIPRLISAVAHWMSSILLHMVWPYCEFRMQVWNVLHAARYKYGTQKWCKKSPSAHHRTTLSGYIFASKACIDNRKKLVKQQYLPHMSLQYGELRRTSGWDRFVSLGHPSKFQRVSRLGSVTARHSTSGRQPNCGVERRAPPVFGRAAITLGIRPHF